MNKQSNDSYMYDSCGDDLPFDVEDPFEVFKREMKAAERGFCVAQFNVALLYANGRGTQKDLAKAVEWFMKAAENGDDVAPYFLGLCYEYGEGVEQDMEKAIEWYMRAAEQGYPEAQIRIALLTNAES